VVFTRRVLAGVDTETGATLWTQSVPNFRGMNIVTPLVIGDSVFVSQYRNGSYRYDVAREGDAFTSRLAWTQKASGYMSSPVLYDGYAYQHLGNGRLTCIDLESGTETWRTAPMGEYWSMLRQGSRILSLSSEGTLRLMQADPTGFRMIDEREVATTSTWGHVVADAGQVFVRELEALTVFGWTHRETVPAGGAVAAASAR
jgi:outer membrane protein assembly factor BamB